MIHEFREFLTKTNALGLAVGVIIGAALGSVVTSLVNDIIMPPIGWILGGVDFSQLTIRLGTTTDAKGIVSEVTIRYGVFINSLITFVIVALIVFIITRAFIKEEEAPPVKGCPFCKTGNAVDATKCRACASAI